MVQPSQEIRVQFTVEPLGAGAISGEAGSPLAALAAADAVERAGLTPSAIGGCTAVQGPVATVSRAMADLVRSAMDAGAASVSLHVARTL
jgi:hypothetical protein